MHGAFQVFREGALVRSLGGIKGAVPIVLATYPAASGLDPDGAVFNIIFFAVLLSCLVLGTTMGPLARLLKLTVPTRPSSPHSVELHSIRKSDIQMFETRIEPEARSVGERIRDLGLPNEILISSIIRAERIVPPKGSTVIEADDLLYVLGPSSLAETVSAALNAKSPPSNNEAMAAAPDDPRNSPAR